MNSVSSQGVSNRPSNRLTGKNLPKLFAKLFASFAIFSFIVSVNLFITPLASAKAESTETGTTTFNVTSDEDSTISEQQEPQNEDVAIDETDEPSDEQGKLPEDADADTNSDPTEQQEPTADTDADTNSDPTEQQEPTADTDAATDNGITPPSPPNSDVTPLAIDATCTTLFPNDGTAGTSEATAYEIASAADLACMRDLVNEDNANYGDKYWELTADIDLQSGAGALGSTTEHGTYQPTDGTADQYGGWVPIGTDLSPFAGDFNGNNKTINGLYIKTTSDFNYQFYEGLFGFSGVGSVIKDTVLRLGTVSGKGVNEGDVLNIGGLIGFSNSTISGISSNIAVVSVSEDQGTVYAGGIVGVSAGLLSDSRSSSTVTAEGDFVYTGGIIGRTYSLVNNLFFDGSVSSIDSLNVFAGGIAGIAGGTITNSASTGDIVTRGTYISTGGIVGETSEDISHVFSEGNISVQGPYVYAGGIVGDITIDITTILNDAFSTGDIEVIEGLIVYVGGIGGYFTGAMSDVHTTGNVIGHSHNKASVGGINGCVEGELKNAYSVGNITAASDSDAIAGGIAGQSWATIEQTYSKGDISVNEGLYTYAGGIVGKNYSQQILSSNSSGSVSSSGIYEVYSGGIAGTSGATISNVFSKGNISVSSSGYSYAKFYSGGIVGATGSMVTQAFSTGNVNASGVGEVLAGGIAGYLAGSLVNAYSLGDITASGGGEVSAGGIIGYLRFEVENVYSAGVVISIDSGMAVTDIYAGGITGYADALSKVSNSVYLGPSIDSSGSYAGRITGYDDDCDLSNNYAYEDSLVNDAVVTDGALDNKDGFSITSAEAVDPVFWTGTQEEVDTVSGAPIKASAFALAADIAPGLSFTSGNAEGDGDWLFLTGQQDTEFNERIPNGQILLAWLPVLDGFGDTPGCSGYGSCGVKPDTIGTFGVGTQNGAFDIDNPIIVCDSGYYLSNAQCLANTGSDGSDNSRLANTGTNLPISLIVLFIIVATSLALRRNAYGQQFK